MRTNLFLGLTIAVPLVVAAAPASADAPAETAGAVDLTKHRVSLEADALPFILSGYDIVVGYQPPFAPRARVIASTHAFDLPGVMVGDGWHGRLRGITLHGQYFSRPGGRGWMFGAQLAYADYEFTRDSAPGMSADLQQIDIAAIGGYRWFPFDQGLFLVGWMKVGVPVDIGGDDMLGGDKLPTRPISIYPSIHVGYEVQL